MAASAFGGSGSKRTRGTPLDPELLSIPYANIQNDSTLWEELKGGAMSGLTYLGQTLNKASRATWGSANYLRGRDAGGGLLNLLPFSDTMGLTDPNNGVELSNFLISEGALSENDPTAWEWGDVSRLAADIVGDPLTWAGPGLVSKGAGKVAKATGTYDDAIKATMKAKNMGPRQAAMNTTLRQALGPEPNSAWLYAEQFAERNKMDFQKFLDKPLGTAFEVGGFGKTLQFGRGNGAERAAAAGDWAGKMWRKTPLYTQYRAYFDNRVRGANTKAGQEVAEELTKALARTEHELAGRQLEAEGIITEGYKDFLASWTQANPRVEFPGTGLAMGDRVIAGGLPGEIVAKPGKTFEVRHVDPESGAATFKSYKRNQISSAMANMTPDELIDAVAKGDQRARVALEAVAAFGPRANDVMRLSDAYAAKWAQGTGYAADDFYERMTFKKGDPSSVGPEALMQGEVDQMLDRLKVTYPDLADAQLKGKYGPQYLFDIKGRGLMMVDPRTGNREMAPLDPDNIDKYVNKTAEWAERRIAAAPEPPEGYRSGRNPFDVEDDFAGHPAYIDGLPKQTQDAVRRYKQAMPIETVGTMRGSRLPTERGYESARLISDAIYDAPPLEADTVLYRSLPMNPGEELTLNGETYQIEKLEPGAVLTSKAPVSTSYSRNYIGWEYTDSKQVAVQFLVPKGSKALAVDSGSSTMREAAGGLAGESEVLLPPGTQFKVIGKKTAPNGHEYVQVEVLSQSKPNLKASTDLTAGDRIGPWEVGNEMAYQKIDDDLFRPVALFDDKPNGQNLRAIYDIVNGIPDGTPHLQHSGMTVGALYRMDSATDELIAEAGLTRGQVQNAAERIRRMNMASSATRPQEIRLGKTERAVTRVDDTVSLFQPGRGAVEFDDAAKTAVITAFEKADITTMVHELGHVFRRWMGEMDPKLLREAEEAIGVTEGNWTRAAEEAFSEQFEKYTQSGVAPTKGLRAVFAKLKDWITSVYQTVVGTPLEQRVNPKLKKVFDDMLSPKAQKMAKDSSLLAQSRAFAAFNQMVVAAAEGQDLKQAWQQVSKRLKLRPGAKLEDLMGTSASEVGQRLKEIQDVEYDQFLAMGGKGELMQGIPGGVDHFFRGVSSKIAKDFPDVMDASLVGGRKFGAVKSRADETRNIATGTVNEMLLDPVLRKANKKRLPINELADVLQRRYVNKGKLVLDSSWKDDLPMEELRPYGKIRDQWDEAVTEHAGGIIDDGQLEITEQMLRQQAHLEDIAEYIVSHKQAEMYTRDARENMLTYLSGVQRAKAAMTAIHDTLRNAIGEGSVTLEAAYRRAGMDPEAALQWMSDQVGKAPGELAKANVPDELVRAITGVQKLYNEKLVAPGWKRTMTEFYDKMTTAFKAGVTILPVTPAYFTRNYVSGQFMNVASGLIENLRDMKDYGVAIWDAMKAATKQGNQWTQEITQNWVGRNQALAGELAKEQALATGKMGLDVRPAGIWGKNRWAEARANAINNPFLENKVPGTTGLRTAWGAATDLGQDVNAWVEWMNRVPLYIYLRKKGWAESAALQQVDRLHFDYGALTPFEKEYMRRLIPFYSFSRRLADTVAEDLVNRPGGPIAQLIKRSGNEDYEPDTPDHIIESLAIPLEGPDEKTKRFLTGTGMPYEDTASLFNTNPLMEIGSRLNPLLKAPIEVGLGRSFFQGRALEDMDGSLGRIGANIMGREDAYQLPQYVEQAAVNLPTARIVNSIRTLTDTRKTAFDKFVNLATGFRITDVSERSRDAVLMDRVTRVAKKRGAKTFERPYFRKGEDGLSPDQAKLNDVFRALAERAKQAKAEAAGEKPKKKATKRDVLAGWP